MQQAGPAGTAPATPAVPPAAQADAGTEAEPPEASDAMFDLPPGFWDEPDTGLPGEPARPANRAAAPVTQVTRTAPVTPAAPAAEEADSPLALVQQLFPGRIVSIERPETADSEALAAEEPAFAADDELPPED